MERSLPREWRCRRWNVHSNDFNANSRSTIPSKRLCVDNFPIALQSEDQYLLGFSVQFCQRLNLSEHYVKGYHGFSVSETMELVMSVTSSWIPGSCGGIGVSIVDVGGSATTLAKRGTYDVLLFLTLQH